MRRREDRKEWALQTIEHINRVAEKHAPGAERVEWTNIDQIVLVLTQIGAEKNRNHTFSPAGGGLDLSGAKLSRQESGCIELDFEGSTSLVRPASLQLERFSGDKTGEWTYLRLNLAELKTSGIYDDYRHRHSEELVEVAGEYEDRGRYDNGECPSEARVVTRHFRGAFVTFAKGSAYNADTTTYDARHSLWSTPLGRPTKSETSAEAFRSYITQQVG